MNSWTTKFTVCGIGTLAFSAALWLVVSSFIGITSIVLSIATLIVN